MKLIKKLGRDDGWRQEAALFSLDKAIRVAVDGKVRQTKRVILCQGFLYPVNRQEQIIGNALHSLKIRGRK